MSNYGGYSRTSHGAGGGEDGGGFFSGSQGGSQTATKPINDESLRPVTLKQIIDAEPTMVGDASFRIDGVDVTQVTFVGMVRQISPQTTNITYRLDDGTGIVEVKQWLDSDKQQEVDEGGRPLFREEEYVRVWGRLKSYGNKRHVGAHVIKPVRDFNEVNYHLLEATYVHLWFTRGAPGAGGGGGGGGGDEDSMFVDGGDGAGGGDSKIAHASPKARKMYNYLNNAAGSNEGVNLHVIARDTDMSVQDVMAAAEELISGGSIYTTLDEETFAILDGY